MQPPAQPRRSQRNQRRDEMPEWAQEWIRDSHRARKLERDREGDLPMQPVGPDDAESSESDIDDESTWHDLVRHRVRLLDVPGYGESANFCTFIRGGRWTRKNRGVVCDTVATRAKAGLPADWADTYQLGRMHTFSIRLYTERGASMLALEVARRMEHFFQLYLAADEPRHWYTDDELASYLPGLPWLDWYQATMDLDDQAAYNRGHWVHRLRPCNDVLHQ